MRDVEAEDPNQIYLVDHAWTFKTDEARKQLTQVPGLVTRMAALMDITEEDEEEFAKTMFKVFC